MKRPKRWLAMLMLTAFVCASVGFAVSNFRIARDPQRRLNVLVVSLCSFRLANLTHYGHRGASVAPNIDKFIANSTYVFDKMFNGVGWTSLFGYTANVMWQDVPLLNGYTLFGTNADWGHFFRIPVRRSDWSEDLAVNDSDFEKDHQKMTDYLKAQILAARSPFYVNAHYKYMHYPLIDRFNEDAGWDRYLDANDRALMDEYLAHPEKHYSKLPLLLLLTNDSKYAFAHPKVSKRYPKPSVQDGREVTGLLTNPEFLAEWKASPGYERDLQLLEKVYQGNVSYIDSVVGPLLDLYGDKELQDNTVVVFSPDHGEEHMERGYLTHGDSLYDEALRVPMAIRFPGKSGNEVIHDQFEFSAIAKLLREVVEGKADAANFRQRLFALKDDVVVTRDCMDTQRGLRYKNEYKYFVRVTDGERFLYDLKSDPGETRNIASERPQVVAELEDLYWRRYPEFTSTNVYRCAPWMLVGESAVSF
ncbi:MAG: sulfatase-like hydrolase/transferase [Bdellovibrionales bacterium]|nr:sulfatase-like hydrolase/transferase [Bdellovibrionales bacterium]